jgi:DNA-binding transcriptional ArsR family regulator
MIKQPATHTNEQLDHLATLFRLLGDRTRLTLLLLLSGGERNVSSLCETLRLPQPTVSHHLGLLRMSNIIGNRREGKQVFYALDDKVNVSNGKIDIDGRSFSISVRPRGE